MSYSSFLKVILVGSFFDFLIFFENYLLTPTLASSSSYSESSASAFLKMYSWNAKNYLVLFMFAFVTKFLYISYSDALTLLFKHLHDLTSVICRSQSLVA